MDAHFQDIMQAAKGDFVAPGGTPRDVSFYLAHCVGGQSIRSAARASGAAPSTVSRAVRRIESQRDDPLMDHALADYEAAFAAHSQTPPPMETPTMARPSKPTKLEITALTKLSEPDSFLLVAQGAEKAGVFSRKNNYRRPLLLLPLGAASRFLTAEWVKCVSKTDLSAKYHITATGRSALGRDAPSPKTHSGAFAEAPSVFACQHHLAGERRVANPTTGEIETIQVNLGESPLGWLSRRKDANGEPLLQPEEVEAGERLREDYELAQIGPKLGQDWRRFLTPASTSSGPGRTPSEGPLFARERVSAALDALGPGLSDAAVRICCFLEGLEATERRMGWSARSGKVVLKLALQRLVDHYGLLADKEAA